MLPLFDPAVRVAAIAARMGVTRAVVTNELVRLRRAGFPVPERPTGFARSARTLAIEDDLREGMTFADVARKHGVSTRTVSGIRIQAGFRTDVEHWTDAERQIVITHQDRPAREVAVLLGRSVRAVSNARTLLITQGLIRPKKGLRPDQAE